MIDGSFQDTVGEFRGQSKVIFNRVRKTCSTRHLRAIVFGRFGSKIDPRVIRDNDSAFEEYLGTMSCHEGGAGGAGTHDNGHAHLLLK